MYFVVAAFDDLMPPHSFACTELANAYEPHVLDRPPMCDTYIPVRDAREAPAGADNQSGSSTAYKVTVALVVIFALLCVAGTVLLLIFGSKRRRKQGTANATVEGGQKYAEFQDEELD